MSGVELIQCNHCGVELDEDASIHYGDVGYCPKCGECLDEDDERNLNGDDVDEDDCEDLDGERPCPECGEPCDAFNECCEDCFIELYG